MRKSLINQGTTATPGEGQEAAKQLGMVANYINYSPTEPQQRAKARLLIQLEDNPSTSLEQLSCEEASRIAHYQFKNYWNQPGFREWLLNGNEFRSKVEHLANLALDAAERILQSDDPRLASAQVALLGKVSELASKIPKSSQAVAGDGWINNLNRAELESYIRDNLPKQITTTVEAVDLDDE